MRTDGRRDGRPFDFATILEHPRPVGGPEVVEVEVHGEAARLAEAEVQCLPRVSGSNAHHLACSDPCDCEKRGRNERSKILKSDARRNQNDNTEPRPSQVLLKLEVLISRDEDLEPGVRGSLKELAVLQTRPTPARCELDAL